MFGKFPRLTSATVLDFCPHPSDQFHNRELGEGCLMHQGHTQTHELMLSVIIQHQSHSSIAADAPTPTPSQKVTDGTEVLECYCPSLLLDGVCVCMSSWISRVWFSAHPRTQTPLIYRLCIYLSLWQKGHMFRLSSSLKPVNYYTLVLRTEQIPQQCPAKRLQRFFFFKYSLEIPLKMIN